MTSTSETLRACAALAATLATAACAGAPARPAAPAATTPSVIFITVDTLRADRLGSYGSTGTKTPRLDELGKESVVFRRAYATLPRTAPALSSLMTGHYPSTHGVRRNGAVLVASQVTLAERLREAGYTTAAFVSNKVMNSKHGLEQGFALYDENLPDPVVTRDESERVATKLVDAALAWADRPHTKPVFLWAHFIDPHGPYTPPGFESKNSPAARALPVSKANFDIDAIPAYQA